MAILTAFDEPLWVVVFSVVTIYLLREWL